MSTDSPIKYNPDSKLKDNRERINNDPRYWEWFNAWWKQDFSWDGLTRHKYGSDSNEQILQEYWKEEGNDLINFGGRLWTRYHLPLHDLEGNKSEKHGVTFLRNETPEQWKNWRSTILNLLKNASEYKSNEPDTRAQFTGVCFPNHFDLSEPLLTNQNPNHLTTKVLYMKAKWAQFGHVTLFSNVEFGDSVDFSFAQFGTHVDFTGAQFGDRAYFARAIFRGDACFANKKEVALPNSLRSTPSMNFHGTTFVGNANFIDRNFGRNSTFSEGIFYSLVEFHGCQFHQNISFADAKFVIPDYHRVKNKGSIPYHWSDPNTGKIWTFNPAYKYQSAFQTLRLHMENLRNREQELKFAKLEMQAKERRFGSKDISFLERQQSRIYGFVAGYGQSVWRPFAGLLLLFLIATIFYILIAGDLTNPIAAMAVGFQYSLPPISTFTSQFFEREVESNFVKALLDHPLWTRLVMVTHGAVSLALVFFLLLALKRRFQIR